jgi:hypothetical protein
MPYLLWQIDCFNWLSLLDQLSVKYSSQIGHMFLNFWCKFHIVLHVYEWMNLFNFVGCHRNVLINLSLILFHADGVFEIRWVSHTIQRPICLTDFSFLSLNAYYLVFPTQREHEGTMLSLSLTKRHIQFLMSDGYKTSEDCLLRLLLPHPIPLDVHDGEVITR